MSHPEEVDVAGVSDPVSPAEPKPAGRLLPAIAALAVLAGGGVGLWLWQQHRPASDPSGQDAHETGGRPDEDHEHHDEIRLDPATQQRWSVAIRAAQTVELKPSCELPGRVAFDQERVAHVGTPLRGRAVSITAKVGDEVKKGAALLTVESPDLGEAQSDYLLKRTLLANAGPKVELAKSVFERAKSLLDSSQLVARSEVERREIDFRDAEASERSAQASLLAAENRLHLYGMTQVAVETLARTGEVDPRITITAPMDGEVVTRALTQGEIVSPDRDALMVLADLHTVWILADVPEGRLQEIAKGARARILVGDGTAVIEGTTGYVAATVDADTRTGQLRVEVHDSTGALRPGMFVRAEVETRPPTNLAGPVLAIPAEAVQTVDGKQVVFVPTAGKADTFSKRVVVTGPAVMGLLPVFSGLLAGDAYVASGTFILKAEFGKGSAAHDD